MQETTYRSISKTVCSQTIRLPCSRCAPSPTQPYTATMGGCQLFSVCVGQAGRFSASQTQSTIAPDMHVAPT